MACVRKYRGRWVCDYRDQHRRRHIETYATKAAAQQRLGEVVTRIGGRTYGPSRAKEPLRIYGEWWLKVKAGDVEDGTLDGYAWAWKHHIRRSLGDVPIGMLTGDAVREFLAAKRTTPTEKTGKPLARNSVKLIRATLRAMLSDAVEAGVIPRNVAQALRTKHKSRLTDGSKAERQRDVDEHRLTREGVAQFLAACVDVVPGWFAFFFTLLRTGLRPGEGLGLQIGDLDFSNRQIRVQRTLKQDRHAQRRKGRSWRVVIPKDGETRNVDMSRQVAEVLGAVVDARVSGLRAAGQSENEIAEAFVFITARGTPRDGSRARKALIRALDAAGLRRIRLHGLRHSYASLLIEQGESLAYIKDQLGHSSIRVTVDCYGHLMPGGNLAAVDKLDEALGFELPSGNKWKQPTPDPPEETRWAALQVVVPAAEEEAGARSRTADLLITNQLLYRLSYASVWGNVVGPRGL